MDVWCDKQGRQMLKGLGGAARKKKPKKKPQSDTAKEVVGDSKNSEQNKQVNSNVKTLPANVKPEPVQSGAVHSSSTSAPGKVQTIDKSAGLKQENVVKTENTTPKTVVKIEAPAVVKDEKKNIKKPSVGQSDSAVKPGANTSTATPNQKKQPGTVRHKIHFKT